jgi:hypothetical protein
MSLYFLQNHRVVRTGEPGRSIGSGNMHSRDVNRIVPILLGVVEKATV